MSNGNSENTDFQSEWLSGYLDGELDDSQRAIVEELLATSESTRVELEELQQLRELVGGLPTWPESWKPAVDTSPDSSEQAAMTLGPDSLDQDENVEEDARIELQTVQPPKELPNEGEDTPEEFEADEFVEEPLPDDDLSEVPVAAATQSTLPRKDRSAAGGWLRFAAIAASLVGVIGLSYPYWFPTSTLDNAKTLAARSTDEMSDESAAGGEFEAAGDAIASEELPLPPTAASEPSGGFVQERDQTRELLDKITNRSRPQPQASTQMRKQEPAATRAQMPVGPPDAAAGDIGQAAAPEIASLGSLETVPVESEVQPPPSMNAMRIEAEPSMALAQEDSALPVPAANAEGSLPPPPAPPQISTVQASIAIESPWTNESAKTALQENRMLLRFTEQKPTSDAQPNNVQLLIATFPDRTRLDSASSSIVQTTGGQIPAGSGETVLLFVATAKLDGVAEILKATELNRTSLLRIRPAEGTNALKDHAVIILRVEQSRPE